MPTEKLATILADMMDTSPTIAIRRPIDIVAAIFLTLFLASVTILGLMAIYAHKKNHKTNEPTPDSTATKEKDSDIELAGQSTEETS